LAAKVDVAVMPSGSVIGVATPTGEGTGIGTGMGIGMGTGIGIEGA